MPPQEKLLCCDWGTSAFRLMLVDASSAKVLALHQTDQGIARTSELWRQAKNAPVERRAFYFDYIKDGIAMLERQTNISLKEVPLILSGMASSSIGMEELPYKALPFATDGSDLVIKTYDDLPAVTRPFFLVSGVKSKNHEVMRGEETLLIGSAGDLPIGKESWFVLPGTHSKHVRVTNGRATELRTFMTGEFFELLACHSILAHAVSKDGYFGEGKTKEFFEKGVVTGLRSNLLQSCFNVRTNRLFDLCNDQENYYFLSGLLIGNELSALSGEEANIILVCGTTLRPLYEIALEVLKTNGSNLSYSYRPADEALIRGQLHIYSFLKKTDGKHIFNHLI